jgi:D-alanyl-D-alanine dipeptidase
MPASGTYSPEPLVDKRGHELPMSTDFDDFTERAHSDWTKVLRRSSTGSGEGNRFLGHRDIHSPLIGITGRT